MVDLSIIITCYNKENYLNELLESIAHQTKKVKEVIIIHDDCDSVCSYDGITSIFQRPNVGVAKARDLGFKLSTCPLILFLDGDDVIPPDYIENAILRIADGYDVVYSDVLYWYEHGSVDYGKENVISRPVPSLKNMLKGNQLIVSCPMKREVYEKVGGFSQLPIFEDYDFWLKAMVLKFKFGKFNSLFWYRQNSGTRNRQGKDLRLRTYREIAGQYEVINNKLVRK